MNKRFILELITGIILLVAIIIFGQKGVIALILMALIPFFHRKKNIDERETQLFYKIGTITAVATLTVSVAVYQFSQIVINGQTLGDNWLFYVLSAFLISHGISGLIVFSKS
ncbi:MAG: hypothetical protein GXO47_05265 [Chlorobi bacterium]|nr:hypothetical protein [Chlorobiota bacterium]